MNITITQCCAVGGSLDSVIVCCSWYASYNEQNWSVIDMVMAFMAIDQVALTVSLVGVASSYANRILCLKITKIIIMKLHRTTFVWLVHSTVHGAQIP